MFPSIKTGEETITFSFLLTAKFLPVPENIIVAEDLGTKTITSLGAQITGKQIRVIATYNNLKNWLTKPVWFANAMGGYTQSDFHAWCFRT